MTLRRIGVRKVIFLTAKLPALLQNPSGWPGNELETTMRSLFKLTVLMQQTEAIQAVLGDGLALERWPFSSPWSQLPTGDAAPPELARVLEKLGREYAGTSGCALAESGDQIFPPPFWIGFGLEKLDKEQASCRVFAYRIDAAKLYADAVKLNKRQLLEPLAGLKKFIDDKGPAHDDVVSTLGRGCPKTGAKSRHDFWKVCASSKKLRPR